MNNQELVNTLRIASKSVNENIALAMLLMMAAERIEELSDGRGGFIEQFDEEKFAELIVRECVTVLNNRFMGDMNREDLEVRRCIADVKQHFGVE